MPWYTVVAFISIFRHRLIYLGNWMSQFWGMFLKVLIKQTLGTEKWEFSNVGHRKKMLETKNWSHISILCFSMCTILQICHLGNSKQMLFLSPLCAQAATWPVNLANMEWTATKPALAMTRTVILWLVPAISVGKHSVFRSNQMLCGYYYFKWFSVRNYCFSK